MPTEVQPPLTLLIDWNVQNLSPNGDFLPQMMLVTPLHSTPGVHLFLDSRLDEQGWEANPQVNRLKEGPWEFFPPFSIRLRDGSRASGTARYFFTVDVDFNEPQNGRNVRYHYRRQIPFCIQISEDKPMAELVAAGGAVINIRGEVPRNLRLSADDKAIINIAESVWHQQSHVEAENSTIEKYEIAPMELLVDEIPYYASNLLLSAKFPNGTTKEYYFFGKSLFRLGRRDADIEYRLNYGEEQNPIGSFLTTMISGKHCVFRVYEDNLQIENCGRHGTEYGQTCKIQPIADKVEIPWQSLQDSGLHTLSFSRLGSINFKGYSAPLLDIWEEALRSHQRLLKNIKFETNWMIGRRNNISTIRFMRRNALTVVQRQQEILASFRHDRARQSFTEQISLLDETNRNYWTSDPYSGQREYFLVLNVASIGNGVSNPIHLSFDQILPVHAGVAYCDGAFWLLNRSAQAIPVSSGENGEESNDFIYQNSYKNLRPGMNFNIGSVRFDVLNTRIPSSSDNE